MKSANQSDIQKAFTQQAAGFESTRMNFTKKDYLDYAVRKISPTESDEVLEVAAGTCVCGRAIAPFVEHVTCLDMTPAMLAVGQAEAEKAHLNNMTFLQGDAAELPFPAERFSIVLSRLAFHHFPDVNLPFAEMVRVLKPGGKLVLIDMAAPGETLRSRKDDIERLRDPSHIRCLTQTEMCALYRDAGLNIPCCDMVSMPTKLQNWLDHTATPTAIQSQIRQAMQSELSGGEKTGFAPYDCCGELTFDQHWVLVIGTK